MAIDLRFLLVAPVALLVGCRIVGGSIGLHPSTTGSGPKVSEARTVGKFSKIRVSSAIHADVKFGPKPSLKIEAQKSILPKIVTHVAGDELVIETTGSLSTDQGMVAHIVTNDLTAVSASGASTVDVDPLKAQSFDAFAEGASKVNVSGEAKNVKFTVEGASTVNAEKLESTNATVVSSGASTVNLGKTAKLNAQADGASNIHYQGNPTIVRSESNGASNIGPKN